MNSLTGFVRGLFRGPRDPREDLDLIFAETTPEGGLGPHAAGWVKETLDAQRVDRMDHVGMVRSLRRAKPELSLLAANYLARHYQA